MGADHDVVVVGAGLAGLHCAGRLTAAGLDVLVLEASDDVGGRVRTDVIDGYRCDRGFQVLNPAYPRVRSDIDLEALGMRPFGRGVGVLRDSGRTVLADPLRRPARLVDMVRSGYLRPARLLPLARWVAPALGSVQALTTDDLAWSDSLDRAGVWGPVRREVIERFLEGTVLEADGSSSAAYVRLLVRAFVLGTPGVPAEGMAALPRQLAARLGRPVQTGARVTGIKARSGVARMQVEGGDDVTARRVVVAADPLSAARLAGVEAPTMKGIVTWWFAADEAPTSIDMILLDSRSRSGPAVNTAVMTNAAPSYAPAGQHLIQASHRAGRRPGDRPDERAVRRQLAEIYGRDTTAWRLVTVHEVRDALPAQPPPLELRRPVRVDETTVVCGDHRDTASIQGALVSGVRAARAVLEPLAPSGSVGVSRDGQGK